MDLYIISLVVTAEQENAIIRLYAERCWAYLKTVPIVLPPKPRALLFREPQEEQPSITVISEPHRQYAAKQETTTVATESIFSPLTHERETKYVVEYFPPDIKTEDTCDNINNVVKLTNEENHKFSSASFTMTQELDTQNTRIETECLSSGKEYRAPAETCMDTDLNATEATEYDLNASAGLVDDENAHKAAVDDPNTYPVVIHDVNTPKTITHTMLPSNKRRRSKRKSYFGYRNIRNNKLAYQKRVRDTKTGVKSSKTGSKMSKNDDHILNAKQHMDTHCGELPQIQDQATDIDKAEQYADVEDIDKPFIEIPNKNINLGDMKAKYQCKDCKHKFKSVKAFQVHKNEDGICKSWTCEICSKVFHSGKTNFNSHIKAHNKQHSLKCKCKRKFPNSKHLEKRLKKCALNGFAMKPFKCDKCNHSTTAEHLLHIHKLKEHNSTDGIYHCYKCPKEFVNLHSLYGHLLQVHGTGNCPERPCIICGKLFSTSCGLKRHEASHSDIKQFKCEECPRAFKTKPELIKHQKKHIWA